MRPHGLAVLLAALAACAHGPRTRVHPTARLVSLEASADPSGAVLLAARYQLDGLRFSAWTGTAARLDVSVDDAPFASTTVEPRQLPGDALLIPLALAPSRREGQGRRVRVRMRGDLELQAGGEKLHVPTDDEAQVVLPGG